MANSKTPDMKAIIKGDKDHDGMLSFDEFKEVLNTSGGFISAHWDGTPETEEKIKNETKATIRCIPLDDTQKMGKCVYSGNPSKQRVIFARAY